MEFPDYEYEEDYTYYDDEISDYFSDDSQNFHRDQLKEKTSSQTIKPLPPVSIPDPSVAICYSLDQSKALIQKRFGVNSNSLRTHPYPGIVIMALKDINLIRKDHRLGRAFPHILITPDGEQFPLIHKDFAQCIAILNSKNQTK